MSLRIQAIVKKELSFFTNLGFHSKPNKSEATLVDGTRFGSLRNKMSQISLTHMLNGQVISVAIEKMK